MEKFLERIMYSARWILAPIYLGLSLVLMLLAVKFFQEIIHVVPHILEKTEAELILLVLALTSSTRTDDNLHFSWTRGRRPNRC